MAGGHRGTTWPQSVHLNGIPCAAISNLRTKIVKGLFSHVADELIGS